MPCHSASVSGISCTYLPSQSLHVACQSSEATRAIFPHGHVHLRRRVVCFLRPELASIAECGYGPRTGSISAFIRAVSVSPLTVAVGLPSSPQRFAALANVRECLTFAGKVDRK